MKVDVVVLPCVPQTAIPLEALKISASTSPRYFTWHSDFCAAKNSGLSLGTAGVNTHTSRSCVMCEG